MTRLLPVVLGALLALAAAHAQAAEPTQAAEPQLSPEQLREASAILGDTWSPFCPGRTLSSCTSGKAAAWREDVRRWLAEGLTREQILARLQTRVPEFTLETVPETGGTRYGPWVLGGAFLVALAGLGLYHARRSAGGRSGGEASPVAPEKTPEVDRSALSRELDALED